MIHFHRHANDDGFSNSLSDLVVGHSERLFVSTVTYEKSFQLMNLNLLHLETLARWPAELSRLERTTAPTAR
jgi:hypothetical protein